VKLESGNPVEGVVDGAGMALGDTERRRLPAIRVESGIFAVPGRYPLRAPWYRSDGGDEWVHLLGTFVAMELG
jgi:hypothetical protein